MNFYDKLKGKCQKEFLNQQHFFTLFNMLLSRYEWEGLPDNIPPAIIEGILLSNGTVGVFQKDSGLWAVWGGYSGNVHGYLPSEYNGSIAGVGDFRGEVGYDCAVGWNNDTRTPELLLMQTSSILTEIDVSEKINVLFSRFMRIPKVKDQKEKEVVKNAIRSILNGNIEAIVSDNIMDSTLLLDGVANRVEPFLELTDVREVDKLQYLNQYHDNIMKRFWSLYGQRMQVTSKMAQMSNDEVHSNDNVNMILTLQGLRLRKKLCEDVNALFGTSWSVQLAEAWQDNYEETVAMNNEEGGESNADNQTETGEDSGPMPE